MDDAALRVLQTRFGRIEFRDTQLQIIRAVLSGNDTLVVLSTGFGKSLTFQVPAVVESESKGGFYVVVSPLLALMRDQLEQLQSLGVSAASVNSEMSPTKRRNVLATFTRGDGCLLYVSPEQCLTTGFTEFLNSSRQLVRRIVVDEAHCAVEWGADFRADYARLGKSLRSQFPSVPFMALTGTASPSMRRQILKTLGFNAARTQQFVGKVHRPYLHYEVRYVEDQYDRLHDTLKFLKMYRGRIALLSKSAKFKDGSGDEYPGCGIVYCRSRLNTELVAQEINREFGECAAAYHAGLLKAAREDVLDRWTRGDSTCAIVVATIAFGLGIDKADTRFVIHFNMPQNIEAYVQQTGRGGRDRKAARCIMYYSATDSHMCQKFATRNPQQEAKAATLALLQYATNTAECRHAVLGRYFGDTDGRQHCIFACDFCKNARRLKQRYEEWYTSQY